MHPYMESGILVPDHLIVNLIKKELHNITNKSWLLDGKCHSGRECLIKLVEKKIVKLCIWLCKQFISKVLFHPFISVLGPI